MDVDDGLTFGSPVLGSHVSCDNGPDVINGEGLKVLAAVSLCGYVNGFIAAFLMFKQDHSHLVTYFNADNTGVAGVIRVHFAYNFI